MKDLPDQKTLEELLELAKDAYEKAKRMYETATEIAQRWDSPSPSIQKAVKQKNM